MTEHAYRAVGYIEKADWAGRSKISAYRKEALAVGLTVAIPVSDFTGLDLTRPITITQEADND